MELTIRLPEDKLNDLITSLKKWIHRRTCQKQELLSLIGSLSFACKVVKCGRIFLRRLIDLSTTVSELHHYVTINKDARKDLEWWNEFLPLWNGVSFIQSPVVDSHELNLCTDASGIGIGGFYKGSWFSIPVEYDDELGIAYFELLAVLFAVFTWGKVWKNRQILLFTDNESICQIWSTGSCKSKDIMNLVRHLFFFIAQHNINLLLRHIPGRENNFADLLSRLQVAKFMSLCPDADTEPANVPEEALKLLER